MGAAYLKQQTNAEATSTAPQTPASQSAPQSRSTIQYKMISPVAVHPATLEISAVKTLTSAATQSLHRARTVEPVSTPKVASIARVQRGSMVRCVTEDTEKMCAK